MKINYVNDRFAELLDRGRLIDFGTPAEMEALRDEIEGPTEDEEFFDFELDEDEE